MWRPALPPDDPAIARMSVALFREDPSPKPPPTENDVLAILAWLRREPVRGKAVVFETEGVIVGYALLVSFLSNELKGEVVTVDEIYVERPHRGRGHASTLFQLLEKDPSLWGSNPVAVELEVSPDNRSARALYERLGFSSIRNALMRKNL